jgi:CTP:molybdopterin cytidylyltransferase MocA
VFAVQQETWSLTATASAASLARVGVVHVALGGEHTNGADGHGTSLRRRGRGPVVEGLALSLGLAAAEQNQVVVVSKTADPPSHADLARFATALIEGVRRAQLRSTGADGLPPPIAQTTAPADGRRRG